jgi:protein-S-isoprenylcysteine O-methyltransferase Ste14
MHGIAVRRGIWPSLWLASRSLLWTILLPGIVAGYVPWRFFGLAEARIAPRPADAAAVACIAAGIALLAACIWEFARSGRGTLSPIDPPRHLVVRGPYRYVRNPMYLGVTLIVLGEALLARSARLAAYWALWFLFVNAFVVAYEEPSLRAQFGDPYDAYARRVRRWIPAMRPAREERDTEAR